MERRSLNSCRIQRRTIEKVFFNLAGCDSNRQRYVYFEPEGLTVSVKQVEEFREWWAGLMPASRWGERVYDFGSFARIDDDLGGPAGTAKHLDKGFHRVVGADSIDWRRWVLARKYTSASWWVRPPRDREVWLLQMRKSWNKLFATVAGQYPLDVERAGVSPELLLSRPCLWLCEPTGVSMLDIVACILVLVTGVLDCSTHWPTTICVLQQRFQARRL